jgi:hypothetical protein
LSRRLDKPEEMTGMWVITQHLLAAGLAHLVQWHFGYLAVLGIGFLRTAAKTGDTACAVTGLLLLAPLAVQA